MPADPTTTVPPSERLPTDPAGIGHVAPDFKDRKHFNTLVIRPEYRISIRLGKIEELFADSPDSVKGRRARMQLLGMNYLPMNHSLGALAYNSQWDHYKNKILAGVSDADADADIQTRLVNWVVDGGVLPSPADDPASPQPANFKKIRFPGAHTYFKPLSPLPSQLYKPSATSAAPYPNVSLSDDLYDYETTFISENPVLDKIPIVALVEKRDPETAEWSPVPGAAVCIQLVKPYDLPAFDASKATLDQVNRPPIRATNMHSSTGGGPKKLTDTEEGRNASADDPQVKNAHKDRGGKRGNGSLSDGTDVADVIFSTKDVKGFNSANGSRAMSHKPYKKAEKVSSSKHLHAVKTVTNEDGESGVIFMPGRCSGDRFRLRAYLSNPLGEDLQSDGTGITGVSVETGTLVIWRHIRVSQYIRQPISGLNSTIRTDWSVAPYSYSSISTHKSRCSSSSGLCDLNVDGKGDDTTTFDGVQYAIAKAFCEVEFDPGADSPANITKKQWDDAVAEFKFAAARAQSDLSLNYDIDALIYKETGSTVNESDSFCCIPMRTAKAYNDYLTSKSSSKQKINYATNPATETDPTKKYLPSTTDINNISRIVMSYGMSGFIRALTKFGMLPGITAFDGGAFATWMLPGHLSLSSGRAMEYRGFYIWFGKDCYPASNAMASSGNSFPYDYTSNFLHEMGHCRFRPHAQGHDSGGSDAGGATRDQHDKLADSICVMSYQTCEGQYCAKCHFTHRGWDRKQMPAST